MDTALIQRNDPAFLDFTENDLVIHEDNGFNDIISLDYDQGITFFAE